MSDQDPIIIQPTEFTRAEAPTAKPLFAPSPLKVAVLVLFLLLGVAAVFMFTARAVKFTFDPPEASLDIISGLPTYQLGERYLMLGGDYDIRASAEGYKVLAETVTVTDEADQDYYFELEPLPGIVQVQAFYDDTEVTGVEVFIDQEYVGDTPLLIDEVAAGTRDISLSHPRYLPYQGEVTVRGMRLEESVSANLEPAWAMIEISSVPDGADILVDGESLGSTSATLPVLQGSRSLQLRLPGYKTFESVLEVVAGEDQVLDTANLIKADGTLSISSEPGGVSVTISGRYYGQTPLSVALPPSDSYDLTATKAGYETVRRSLRIDPEEDRNLVLRLNPVVGQVRLMVEPAGATLYVNNQSMGDPNRTLELPARPHEIRVDLPGFASFVTEVTPQPGLPQQLNIQLMTEEEARVSAIPQQITTSLGDVLRLVLPGELKMGAGRREPGRRSNEIQKTVELTRAFYLGEKEISNQSFQRFAPSHESGSLGRALLSDPERPVVQVPWEQAVAYCNWLSQREGLTPAYEQVNGRWKLSEPVGTGYRLPTEAEWAWAARYDSGHQGSRFPWGDSMPPPSGAGNFADESATAMVPYTIKGYNDNFRGPSPPGTFDANALGIFDLAGNVSEWMNDIYSIELQRETLVDPLGADQGDYYVIRGSNYTNGRFSELRWTFRDYGAEGRADVGFRIARYVEEAED